MTKVHAKVGGGSPFSAVHLCGKTELLSCSTASLGHLYKPRAGLFSITKGWHVKY